MARNPYNDFPPNARTKAGQWYRRQVASGLLVVDDNCMTCGSPQRVNGHSEDYSSPYGPHIGAFDLCWFCHMMIHCRKRNLIAWDRYCEHVEDTGLWFPCNGYDFDRFKGEFLANRTEYPSRFPFSPLRPKSILPPCSVSNNSKRSLIVS